MAVWCSQMVGAASATALMGRGDSTAGIVEAERTLWFSAGTMAGSLIGALGATVFVVALVPGIGRLAGLSGLTRRWGDIARGICGIAVVYPLAWALGWGLTWIAMWFAGPTGVDPLAHETLREIAENPGDAGMWAVVALVVLGAPVAEEIIYRGFFQRGIAELTGKRWAAILITSALFASVHLGAVEWHALPVLFLLSIGFGVARERTGSVIAPIVMHAAFNAANVAMVGVGM